MSLIPKKEMGTSNMQYVFEAAKNYDFETLRRFIDHGGSINICDKDGISVLTYFIEAYLTKERTNELDRKKDFFKDHDEYDYEFWDEYVYDFQNAPLDKRGYNIHQELDYLFYNGADANLCKLVDGMAETPLYYSVCVFQDYYMTKYLLEHNADPGIWLFDEKERMRDDQEYYLMDDLDIAIINGTCGRAAENIVAIAQLLWEYGLKNWGGHCIDIEPTKGVIGVHALRVKF